MKNYTDPAWNAIINILGTDWTIVQIHHDDDPNLEDSDGYCDDSIKKITIDDCEKYKNDHNAKKDLIRRKSHVIRHEMVHAVLSESGLSSCSWADNEEMVDWIAAQFPKMAAAFKEVGCL